MDIDKIESIKIILDEKERGFKLIFNDTPSKEGYEFKGPLNNLKAAARSLTRLAMGMWDSIDATLFEQEYGETGTD